MSPQMRIFRKFLESKYLAFALFLCASVVTYTQSEVSGALVFLAVICVQLVFCENTFATLAPFLMLCTFIVTCYDSFNLFIVYLPIAPVAVMCVIYHLAVYRRKFTFGESFLPLCAVAVAVTLGGLGTIPIADYFAPSALFYTFGLGVGMIGVYLILRSRYTGYAPEMQEKIKERFAFDMYLMGMTAVTCVFSFYLREIEALISDPHIVDFQASNNLSTFLMLAMPFTVYFTMNKRHKCSGDKLFCLSDLHLIPFGLTLLAIFLTDSRGGLMFGAIEFTVCLAFTVYNRSGKRRIFYTAFALCSAVAVFFVGKFLLDYLRVAYGSGFISSGEVRGGLLERAIEDFKRNVLFGSGFGYMGNTDLYDPVKGAMNWYHMYPAQVIGSFGLLGVLGFGYMILSRLCSFLRRPTAFSLTIGLSYLGILMMSMVNPGEFCPVPYEMLVVMMFALIDEGERVRPTFFSKKVS